VHSYVKQLTIEIYVTYKYQNIMFINTKPFFLGSLTCIFKTQTNKILKLMKRQDFYRVKN